jgi:uncharacterized protein YkwD
MKTHRFERWLTAATTLTAFLGAHGLVQAQQRAATMETPIITWTNMARQQYGRPVLTPNARLTWAAQQHALNMAAQEIMSHTLDGRTCADRVKLTGYPYVVVGENVAYNFGYANPDWKLFESWVKSPGHWQNIMHPEFTEIGVGVAQSRSGKFYACQVFGRAAGPLPSRVVPYHAYPASRAMQPSQDTMFYYYQPDE